ncbi:MAG: HAD family hydrolase, partial [Flammeovirgaceae bacterium]
DATVDLNEITDEDDLANAINLQITLIEDAVKKTLPEDLDYQVLVSLEKKDNVIQGFNVDIMPSKAGKDKALEWLISEAKKQNKEYEAAVFCGDTGNDKPNMYPEIWREQGI